MFGLVHEHKYVTAFYVSCTFPERSKKACAKDPHGGACRLRVGRRWRLSRVVDPHHDRRGERRSSFPSFPVTFPTMCPNVNRQSSLWVKWENTDSGWGAVPMSPRLPRVLRA